MKVCFLVGTLGRGGAEKQLVYMLRALRQNDIAARVLCLTRGESYESEIRDLGVEVEWVGKRKNQAARLLDIIANLRNAPADIVQSSHFYTNIYAGIAGKLLQIPSIGAIRSDLTYELAAHKITGRWQLSLPRFLITNSETARRAAIEQGSAPHSVEVVRNVVEIAACAKSCVPHQPLKILFVGRLDRNKRPDRFVRLASILTTRFPKLALQFQIAGDGELKTELENQACDLNLSQDKLKFLGVCRNMGEIYRQADILISTSEREGSPNAVLEAMAYGLPVAATNVSGTAEILNEKRGLLAAPDDENELVNHAAELILNSETRRRFGQAGQRYARQYHSLDSLRRNLSGIYERLLDLSEPSASAGGSGVGTKAWQSSAKPSR